jgi:HEAT repeat protein
VCSLVFLAAASAVWAVPAEDQLISQLGSGDSSKVVAAFQSLEKNYPLSTNVVPFIKKMVGDSREAVKRKAAREAGIYHVDLSADELKQVCSLLTDSNWRAVEDGLKALRDLKKPDAAASVVPCLKNPNDHVMRDACRTLAVIGDKSVVPSIQPLLSNPNPAVHKDAQDAIDALNAKP